MGALIVPAHEKVPTTSIPTTSDGVPAAARMPATKPVLPPADSSDSGSEAPSFPPVDTWFDETPPDFCNAVEWPPMTWDSFF